MYVSLHNPATGPRVPCPGPRLVRVPRLVTHRRGMGDGAATPAAIAAQNAFVAALNAGTATPALAIAAGYNPNVISNGKWNYSAVSQMVAGLSPGQPGYNEALQAASALAAQNAKISTQPAASTAALPGEQAAYQAMMVSAPAPAPPAAPPPSAAPSAPPAAGAPPAASSSTSTSGGNGAAPPGSAIVPTTAPVFSSGGTCLAFFSGETCIGPIGATTLLVGGLGLLALSWMFGGKKR